ncbi:dephospho-CoA kinase [Halothermothrix orenii]|uniref:Multifunctional fusion protein n=1 Tax=Halothermothrix orenii (strain H 168 / OCM 544 / DSM 9562) TaxID=373903 RepID=B8D220_HALOH|nr:dephospho-CoA kinase [Halothermothrix orenii]ACL69247.1 Dephospho-CoA kinase [Halothermothrix orenii H 168]
MIIGLTGGIASGKSTVSNILKELGACIIDADRIAHKILKKGQPGWRGVVGYFGTDIIDDKGEIDRKKLGKLVFNKPEERKKLEKITHPIIISQIKDEIVSLKNKCNLIILDAPLLFEANLDRLVDRVWVVYVDRDIQLRRLQERDGLSREEAILRIETQMPLKEKARLADIVIDNNGSIKKLKKQVIKHWRELKMKRIALIAHDEKKDDIIEFARKHYDLLKKCKLIATGTTGKMIIDKVGLEVERMLSGPLGGDQMIGSRVAQEKLDGVIFLRDPLTAQPHEPDITALLRVCDVHNVPLATNLATADLILHKLLEE